ncbi:hypothetical protein QUB05_32485 [Microcoleus sp. F10-C6]|uniref:hypothetical protein n=1 Tax=unclassified Microcoleus TaxID=2642155 RepID=UPI002FD48987
MTLEYSSVTEKRLSLLRQLPESIQGTLSRVWQQHYEELYEPEAEDAASLQDALDEILEVFQSNNQTLTHIRYVWMALILASVVEPTVQYYQPLNLLPQKTISKIELWLLENTEKMLDSKKKFSKALIEEEFNALVDGIKIDYIKDKKVANFQIIFEALDVYMSAIKTLDYNQSLESLLDILENCLEGYAIFPGSHGRRELFDWWLLEVVPASWYLRPPSSIYSLEKLGTEKNNSFCQMNKLEEISSAMWKIILTDSTSRPRSNLLPFPNKFEDYLNTIPLDVRLDKWAS